jgi:hypothetical protein
MDGFDEDIASDSFELHWIEEHLKKGEGAPNTG